MEVALVEVALKKPKVGVEVAIKVVPRESVDRRTLAGNAVAFVPPFATGNVPVTSDVRSTDVPRVTVRAPDESDNPVPRRLLNDEPLIMRFVVEAVRKEEYLVEEE